MIGFKKERTRGDARVRVMIRLRGVGLVGDGLLVIGELSHAQGGDADGADEGQDAAGGRVEGEQNRDAAVTHMVARMMAAFSRMVFFILVQAPFKMFDMFETGNMTPAIWQGS